MNFYNETDPYCCDWLENLIREKLIPDGIVDRRSIVDILPAELKLFRQCHFFAGLGGWPLALRRAAYPDNRKIWTGSCPCQPFSAAGKRLGFADDRHLWPYWRYLIAVCRPPAILGEQVASASDWLRLVRGDLEALEYAVGCMPVEAASAGADHLRDRFWFVADAEGGGCAASRSEIFFGEGHGTVADGSFNNGVALGDAHEPGSQGWTVLPERLDERIAGTAGMEHPSRLGWSQGRTEPELRSGRDAAAESGFPFDMANGNGERQPGWPQQHEWSEQSGFETSSGNDVMRSGFRSTFDLGNGDLARASTDSEEGPSRGAISEPGARGYEWVLGADGKARRVKSGIRLLANGVPSRVAKLRALGNAIDPRPAAAFAKAALTY